MFAYAVNPGRLFTTRPELYSDAVNMFPHMTGVVWFIAPVFAAGLGVTTFREQGFTLKPWRLDVLVIVASCLIVLPVGMLMYSLIRTGIMGIPFQLGWKSLLYEWEVALEIACLRQNNHYGNWC